MSSKVQPRVGKSRVSQRQSLQLPQQAETGAHENSHEAPITPAFRPSRSLTARDIVRLQRSVGNRVVAGRLAASRLGSNVVQRVVHPDFANGLSLAQKIKAMFELPTLAERQTQLGKLKVEAEPLKDSAAGELAKLATVIAAGNVNILRDPRASQIQSEATTVLAKAYEARDSGHSLDRHGPGVSDAKLQERLKTGIAPDGAMSPTTGLSTRFAGHEDYVRTRLAAVQGMRTAITATRDDLKVELRAFAQAKKAFKDAPPSPAKAPGGALNVAVQNTQAAVQAKVTAIGNRHAAKMPVKFVPNAAAPGGYITMYQSYSIILDHGVKVGMGFRGKAASTIQIPRPTGADPHGTADAWTDWDKEDSLTRTRTGMDTGSNNQPLFGVEYNPESWEAFQHFPVDEPVGIQI